LTLECGVIDLGAKDFELGLSFVAISRVKSLASIAFHSPFPVSHLRNLPDDHPGKVSMREHLQVDKECYANLPYVQENLDRT
jgi:hypothetical protein